MENVAVSTAVQSGPGFSRAVTDEIKGIALICMFIHHFFTFPEWWGAGLSYPPLARLAPIFQSPFRICVPVFCFLTGYLYSFRKDHSWRYSLRKITDLLMSYWAAFAVLGIAAVVTVRWTYTPGDVVKELFAVNTPTMCFAWYVLFYLFAMMVLPLVPRLSTGKPAIDLTIWVLIVPVILKILQSLTTVPMLQSGLYYLVEWLPCMCVGYLWRGGYGFMSVKDCRKAGHRSDHVDFEDPAESDRDRHAPGRTVRPCRMTAPHVCGYLCEGVQLYER